MLFTVQLFPFLLSCFVLLSTACVRWSPPAIAPVSLGSCRSSEVQWLGPENARERTRLDAWCAGVGTATVRSAPNQITGAVELTDIVFVSWNVHVGNGDIRSFVADLRAGLHTGGRRFPHYVLLLQEAVRITDVPVFGAGASGATRIAARNTALPIDIAGISSDLGTSLIYVPSMRNGGATDPASDRGSAMLSTLPLSEPVAVELPGERQRRVVIIAKAGPVSVAVVHLDALGGTRRLRIFWTPWMRDVQTRSTMSALPEGPLVVGADLNTWHGRDESAVRQLEKLFRATPMSIDRHGLGLRVLDYMFFRAPQPLRSRYRQLEGRYGSDHRPLVGWVE